MDSGDNLVSRTRFRRRSVRRNRRMRCVGNAIKKNSYYSELGLKQSFSRPDRADGADIFQKECEAKTAFNAGADIELTDFEVQAIAVCVVANLRHRTLEE